MQISQSQEPMVSVCIPMYNAEKTIAKTLDSIINQVYKNIEIIIVDNCSSDNSVEIVQKFDDPRIRLIRHDTHFPSGEDNWNRCFNYAKGEFVAIFHSDDIYLPDMVARQVDIFKKFPHATGVFTQADVIDEQDQIIDTLRLPPGIMGDTPYTYQELLPVVLEYGTFLLCPSAMVRSDVYKKLEPFRYDQFGSASDLDMWLRVARTGPVIITKDRLLKYRVSKTQGSFLLRSRTLLADGFKVLDFHIADVGADHILSGDTLGKYELRRMEDQIFCALNFLKKQDFSGFRQHVTQMAWRKYIRIIVTKPRFSLPFLFRGFCKVPNNLKL
jgi:GT2 family glycosyltransferase